MAVGELEAQHDLRHVVAARAELIAKLAAGNELLLLDPVHLAADLDMIGDVAPAQVLLSGVGLEPGLFWLAKVGHASASTTAAAKRSTLSSESPTTLNRPDGAM